MAKKLLKDFGEEIYGARKDFYKLLSDSNLNLSALQNEFAEISLGNSKAFSIEDYKAIFTLKNTWALPTVAELQDLYEKGVPAPKLYFLYIMLKGGLRKESSNVNLLKKNLTDYGKLVLKRSALFYVGLVSFLKQVIQDSLFEDNVHFDFDFLSTSIKSFVVQLHSLAMELHLFSEVEMRMSMLSQLDLLFNECFNSVFSSFIVRQNRLFSYENLKFFCNLYDFPKYLPNAFESGLILSELEGNKLYVFSKSAVDYLSYNVTPVLHALSHSGSVTLQDLPADFIQGVRAVQKRVRSGIYCFFVYTYPDKEAFTADKANGFPVFQKLLKFHIELTQYYQTTHDTVLSNTDEDIRDLVRLSSREIDKLPYELRYHVLQEKKKMQKKALTDSLNYMEGSVEQAIYKHISKAYQIPHLAHVTRTGALYRMEPAKDEQILNEFKFRGGQYGNWQNQSERQACLNYFYDALLDLSLAMNLSCDAIGLQDLTGEGLGIAFGSRGHSRAAAHFEPGQFVINLTKYAGAGCFAHEYGHALSNALYRYMLQGFNCNFSSAEAVYHELSFCLRNRQVSTLSFISLLKNFKFLALSDNSSALKPTLTLLDKNFTRENLKKFKLFVALWNFIAVAYFEYSDLSPVALNELAFLESGNTDELTVLRACLEKLKDCGTLYLPEKCSRTKFDKDSVLLDKALNKRSYYSDGDEKFARLFESCIESILPYKSTYLVSGTNVVLSADAMSGCGYVYRDKVVHLYPMGDTRKVIISEFQKFMAVYKEVFGFTGFSHTVIDPNESQKSLYLYEYLSKDTVAQKKFEEFINSDLYRNISHLISQEDDKPLELSANLVKTVAFILGDTTDLSPKDIKAVSEGNFDDVPFLKNIDKDTLATLMSSKSQFDETYSKSDTPDISAEPKNESTDEAEGEPMAEPTVDVEVVSEDKPTTEPKADVELVPEDKSKAEPKSEISAGATFKQNIDSYLSLFSPDSKLMVYLKSGASVDFTAEKILISARDGSFTESIFEHFLNVLNIPVDVLDQAKIEAQVISKYQVLGVVCGSQIYYISTNEFFFTLSMLQAK